VVTFERGEPVALDGEALAPVALIERLNERAGALGAGRGYHLGDTVLGIKGRIAFEAPAAEVLLGAHRELEKLVLTEEQRSTKDQLGDQYGRRLHQGLFHDPLQRDIEALFASSQGRVTGRARVLVQAGAVRVEGVESPFSLMSASDARYGERAATGTDPRAALGFARILAEPGRLHRKAGSSHPGAPGSSPAASPSSPPGNARLQPGALPNEQPRQAGAWRSQGSKSRAGAGHSKETR
jgi:argininosuccinate synthase